MFTTMKQGSKMMPYVNEYVVDTVDDLSTIDVRTAFPGSVCVVIATSDVYMLSHEKKWELL